MDIEGQGKCRRTDPDPWGTWSGKSQFAQHVAEALGEKAHVYVATAEAGGDEMREWVFQLVRQRLDER